MPQAASVRESRFPVWLRRPFHIHGRWEEAKRVVRDLNLRTVCEEALCPNLGECWSDGNVSFMILGGKCTRRCSFCAVTTARPDAVDPEEPQRLAEAVVRLKLRYVVVTSVARDDLPDEGAGLFRDCVCAIKRRNASVGVEVLTPDFHARPDLIQIILEAEPDVYNHNLETVSRLSREVRPQADYQRSLEVIRLVKGLAGAKVQAKSGIMVGMGETPEEVRHAMTDLRRAGCDIFTIGQYLQPSVSHRMVHQFVPPEQFFLYRRWAEELGFSFVASGPYVRSSYNAHEVLKGSGPLRDKTEGI